MLRQCLPTASTLLHTTLTPPHRVSAPPRPTSPRCPQAPPLLSGWPRPHRPLLLHDRPQADPARRRPDPTPPRAGLLPTTGSTEEASRFGSSTRRAPPHDWIRLLPACATPFPDRRCAVVDLATVTGPGDGLGLGWVCHHVSFYLFIYEPL